MDFRENDKINNISQKSSDEQLDKVLGSIGTVPENKKEVEKKVFLQFEDVQKNKQKKILFKDLGWYWEIIKKPVLALAGLEFFLYILALVPSLKLLMIGVFDPILLLVDFVFFGWLFAQVIKKKKESMWQGLVTVFLAGFALGLLLSIFKAFWIREYWTLFNVMVEPVYRGVLAVAVGLAVSLVVKGKNSLR